jgi:hypothetical protein
MIRSPFSIRPHAYVGLHLIVGGSFRSLRQDAPSG